MSIVGQCISRSRCLGDNALLERLFRTCNALTCTNSNALLGIAAEKCTNQRGSRSSQRLFTRGKIPSQQERTVVNRLLALQDGRRSSAWGTRSAPYCPELRLCNFMSQNYAILRNFMSRKGRLHETTGLESVDATPY